jgi:hypothetical protein
MTAEGRRLQQNGFRGFHTRAEQINTARHDYLHSFLRDPLARLLVKTMRFSAWKGFFISLGIVVLTYALRMTIHYWQNGDLAVMGKFIIDCLYDLMLVPATVGVYIWLSAHLPYVTFALSRNGVRWNPPDDESRHVDAEVHRRILNGMPVFLSAIGVMMLLLAIHFIQFHEDHWLWSGQRADRLLFFLLKVPFTWLIPWYMVAVLFFKQIIFILHYRRVFSLPGLQVNLQHPDRCGGLKVFSDCLLRFTYYLMLCAFGIALLATRSIRLGSFQRDFLLHILILGYIPVCLFFFYFPLHPLRLRIKILLEEFRERIKDGPLVYLGLVSPGMQKRFLAVMLSPFVFFCLLKLLFTK